MPTISHQARARSTARPSGSVHWREAAPVSAQHPPHPQRLPGTPGFPSGLATTSRGTLGKPPLLGCSDSQLCKQRDTVCGSDRRLSSALSGSVSMAGAGRCCGDGPPCPRAPHPAAFVQLTFRASEWGCLEEGTHSYNSKPHWRWPLRVPAGMRLRIGDPCPGLAREGWGSLPATQGPPERQRRHPGAEGPILTQSTTILPSSFAPNTVLASSQGLLGRKTSTQVTGTCGDLPVPRETTRESFFTLSP